VVSNPDKPPPFDAAADRYDADELGNRVLAHMRGRFFEQLRAAFAPGARLLDLGSGTGTDAARLVSERGCRVALLDVSPRLLDRAATKVRAAGAGGLLGAHRLGARSVGELAIAYGREFFDGAYSDFGALNCEADLDPVARGLAEVVRPGGGLVLSVINRWCPMEFAWFALRGRLKDATRRWGGPVRAAAYSGGPRDVLTFYYSRREIERSFRAAFRVEHVEALPLFLPPPYLDFLLARLDGLVRAVEPVEAWAARLPLLRELGDHVLVRLRRR